MNVNTHGGIRGKGQYTQYGEKQLACLYNPFTVFNNSPKFPDGLANMSLGKKLHYSSEIYGRDTVICLFPGSTNWCVAFTWSEVQNRMVVLANHNNAEDTLRSTFEYSWKNKDDQAIGSYDTMLAGSLYPKGWHKDRMQRTLCFDSWRGVAYALHVNCCNSDEDNDGWFECIRTNRISLKHRLGFIIGSLDSGGLIGPLADWPDTKLYQTFVPSFNIGDVLPATKTAQEWFSARNWALSPSYATGKLKNIQKCIFKLNHCTIDNEFTTNEALNITKSDIQHAAVYKYYNQPYYTWMVALNQNNTFTANTYADTPPTVLTSDVTIPPNNIVTPDKRLSTRVAYAIPFTEIGQTQILSSNFWDPLPTGDVRYVPLTEYDADTTGPNTVSEIRNDMAKLVSNSFDAILIRVHGLGKTRLNLHSVACFELMCNERNRFADFQTTSYAAKEGLERFIENTNKYQKLPFTATQKYYILD